MGLDITPGDSEQDAGGRKLCQNFRAGQKHMRSKAAGALLAAVAHGALDKAFGANLAVAVNAL